MSTEAIVGVCNAFVGSFLSALGYAAQKWTYNRILEDPELGHARHQKSFIIGYLLLVLGALSALANLALMGQSAQAPFAALGLIYNALLAHKVNGEVLTRIDVLASTVMITGVAVSVSNANLEKKLYNLKSLMTMFSRATPIFYAIVSLSVVMLANFLVKKLDGKKARTTRTLFTFALSAGLCAGFNGLCVKSSIEILKGSIRGGSSGDLESPMTLMFVVGIPLFLVSQLRFMNSGLHRFDSLQFVPAYQSSIIVGNMLSGVMFFDELNGLPASQALLYMLGVFIVLTGVVVLMLRPTNEPATILPLSDASEPSSSDSLTLT